MNKGIIPRSGIDIDARWGFSHTKGWIFGYKLHMISSTGSTIAPLAADFTTANIQDNHHQHQYQHQQLYRKKHAT
jgi:hypothetical protein